MFCTAGERPAATWQAAPSLPSYNIQLELRDGRPPVAGSLLLDWQDDNRGCRLDFAAKGLQARIFAADGEKPAGRAAWPKQPFPDLLIKRRAGRILVYGGETLLLTVVTPVADTAQWGMTSTLGAAVADHWIQKVGDIVLRDDFMRAADAAGAWTMHPAFSIVSGANTDKLMNPYSCRARSREAAAMEAGHPFWENYRLSAAVMAPDQSATLGLLCGAREERAGFLVHWRDGKLSVTDRKGAVLATAPAPRRPHQWYELAVESGDDGLRVFVDGVGVVQTSTPVRGGSVGLLVEGGEAWFDDIAVAPLAWAASAPAAGVSPPVYSAFHLNDAYMTKWAAAQLPPSGLVERPEYFSSQAVNWLVQEGNWRNFPRWQCEMEHAFFGARPGRQSLAWYKQNLEGDFRIDLFVAFPMFARRLPFYNYPLNIQLLVHNGGAGIDDGYRFIFGAFDIPSRILRQGRELASDNSMIVPDVRATQANLTHVLHSEWFHLTMQRSAGRLSLLVDGRVLCQALDPEPLRGGMCGLGNWHNGVSLARARIAAARFGERIGPSSPLYQNRLPEDALAVGVTDDRLDLAALRHPQERRQWAPGTLDGNEWRTDFTAGIPPWMQVRGAEGGQLHWQSGHLRVVAEEFGGACAVNLWDGVVPLAYRPQLSFRYRVPPWCHVNLGIKLTSGEWREIAFSDRYDFSFLDAGSITNVQRDAQWHEAVFDFAALQRVSRDAKIERIVLFDSGSVSTTLGSFYEIDDVRLRADAPLPQTAPPASRPPPSDRSNCGAVLIDEDFEGTIPRVRDWRGAGFWPERRRDGVGHAIYVFPREPYKTHFDHIDLYEGTFDPAKFEVVRLDYCSRNAVLQFQVVVDDRLLTLPWQLLQSDGAWHTLTLPLRAALKEAGWTIGQQVEHLIVYPGGSILLDNVCISER